MQEANLEIRDQGGYKVITVRTKYEWNGTKKEFILKDGKKIVKEQGLKPGEFVVVTKRFPHAQELDGPFGKWYKAGVTYKGEDVSFSLDKKYLEAYNSIGDKGSAVRIECTLENVLNKKIGVEVPTETLTFRAA